MESAWLLLLLLPVMALGGLRALQSGDRLRHEIKSLPRDVYERYFGPEPIPGDLPLSQLDDHLRARGWGVFGTDVCEDTLAQMRAGTLPTLEERLRTVEGG